MALLHDFLDRHPLRGKHRYCTIFSDACERPEPLGTAKHSAIPLDSAALDEGKAVPEEGFGLRRARGARPTNAVAGCGGEMAVGVVGEGTSRITIEGVDEKNEELALQILSQRPQM